MIKLENKRGFSLTELLIAVIVGGIVILMIGAIGAITYKSYNNLRNQSSVYNDSRFAMQLIREGIRQSTTAPTISGSTLDIQTANCTKLNFYIQSSVVALCQSPPCLVYDHTCAGGPSVTDDPIISTVTTPVFTPILSTTPIGNTTLYNITFSGKKNGVSFNYSIYASRRI